MLEREARVGGCLHSPRRPDGYWFEMGAHTAYNSYGAMLDIVVGTGIADKVKERGPARAASGCSAAASTCGSRRRRSCCSSTGSRRRSTSRSTSCARRTARRVYSYYSKLLGRRNYDRIFSPVLRGGARRRRRTGSRSRARARSSRSGRAGQEFVRSFGLDGGLQTVCDAAAAAPGVTVEQGVRVTARRAGGRRLRRDGRRRADVGGAGRAVAATADQAAQSSAATSPRSRARSRA